MLRFRDRGESRQRIPGRTLHRSNERKKVGPCRKSVSDARRSGIPTKKRSSFEVDFMKIL